MNAKEIVRDFIENANLLRRCEPVEVGFAFVDLMREMPIKTSYAIYGVMEIYRKHIGERLPEGGE